MVGHYEIAPLHSSWPELSNGVLQPYGVLSMGTGVGKSKTTVGAETVAQLVEKGNGKAYSIFKMIVVFLL